MQIEQLQKEMIAAMKAKDKPRKDAISFLVSVKKAAIDEGCRDENRLIPVRQKEQIYLRNISSVMTL